MRAIVPIMVVGLFASLVPAVADVKAEYQRCSSKLPAPEREAVCSSIIAETHDKVWQERAYKSRGHARMELGRYLDAAADFSETIRLNPKIAGYYDNRQYAYREAGELDDALSDAFAAVRLAPTYAFVWRARALVYMDMAQHTMAIEDFREAIRLDPANGDLYVGYGKAVDATGGTAEAIGWWSKALEVDDETIEAFKLRGLAERKLGRTQAALSDLERYQAIHPDDLETTSALLALRNGGL